MEKIKISLGKTYNLGNYESLRVDVGLERDVNKATKEETDTLYSEVLQLMIDTATKIKVE